MFDGTHFIRDVPGFQLTAGPLLSLWTPVDCHGKFFALTGGEVVSYLLSLYAERLDGQGATMGEAEADLFRKIAEAYDNSPTLQGLLRRTDNGRREAPVSS